MNIDKDVESEVANWKFDKEVTKIFDSHVRKSVPMYDEFHNMISNISEWFIEENSNVYDIGTSTGEGLKQLVDIYKNKNINFIGIDNSKDMIEEVENRFKNYPNISFINDDITKDDIHINNASFITSILTLQFISKRKRRQVLQKIYDGLNNGGAFVLIEKVIDNNARFDEMFIELYHDFKLEQGFNEQEIFNKSRAIRGVMQPNTIEENLELLNSVGFGDTDIFFKWCNFVGIIAIK
jgi:tRNA (cmo5U34)-methyltransferase